MYRKTNDVETIASAISQAGKRSGHWNVMSECRKPVEQFVLVSAYLKGRGGAA